MDILRNLFGHLSAGIIRLLVTVGILAAVYFFIVSPQVQREIKRSFRASKQQGDADKLIRCIQRAHHDVNKIQRCSERFQ